MARVYAAPASHPAPKITGDGFEAYDKACDAHIASLATLARKEAKDASAADLELIGETVGFPIADGRAQYMVWSVKPLTLVWLQHGDAWQIPAAHARGLRVADIRAMVKSARGLRSIFGNK